MLKKIIRILDRAEDIFIIILCLCVAFIALYAFYDTSMLGREADMSSPSASETGDSYDRSEKQIQGNMAGRLIIDNTSVDYPVMQGKTNSEYLSKDPYGEFYFGGSIFMDYRNSFDLSDSYTLIYGHHMENEKMFGALELYENEEYFNSHKTGTFVLNDENKTTYELNALAVIVVTATDEIIFSPGKTGADEVIDHVKNIGGIRDMDGLESFGPSGKLVALSTCRDTESLDRIIVLFEAILQ